MAEVGGDFWRSSGPTLLLKPGHLELAAQDHVQMALDCLQGWRVHHLSHPHSEKVFPDVQREPPVFPFVPMATCPITGHHWKEEPGFWRGLTPSRLFLLGKMLLAHLLSSPCSTR